MGQQYHVERSVPIFDAHTDKDGQEFDEKYLRDIVANNNVRIRDTGDLVPLVDRHTDDTPDADPPKILGWAKNFKLGKIGRVNPRACVLADLFFTPQQWEQARQRPRRSAEVWLHDRLIDPIALLVKTPKRDLGLMFSRDGKKYRHEADFDEAKHKRAGDGKFTGGGTGGSPAGPKKPEPKATAPASADRKAVGILARVKSVPKAALSQARNKVATTYRKLESRYGPRYAKAIVAAGLAGVPLPLPGASFATAGPVLAVAELHRRLSAKRNGANPIYESRKFAEEMSAAEIDRLGRQFVRDVTRKENMDNELVQQVLEAIENTDWCQWIKGKMEQEEGAGQEETAAEEETLQHEAEEEQALSREEEDKKPMAEEDEEEMPRSYRLKCQRDQARREVRRYQRETESLKSQFASLQRRVARAEREKELIKLEAEGVRFDMGEELAAVEAMDDKQYKHHLGVMRKRYQRAPVGVHVDVARVADSGGKKPFDKTDMDRALSLLSTKKARTYEEAVEMVKGGN